MSGTLAAATRTTGAEEPLVVAEGVHLAPAGNPVLHDVSFRVRPGEVVGLVGRNGAGKTTLLHVLLGLVRPQAGTVRPLRGTGRVGVAFDALAAPPAGTVGEAVSTLRRYVRPGGGTSASIESLVGAVRGDRIRHLSHGTRQRLAVVLALLGDPDLVVLDEPYNGLDPLAMAELGRLVRGCAARGAGVVLSSHYVAALDDLCDRVVLLEGGRVVLDAAVADVLRPTGHRLECAEPGTAAALLRSHGIDARPAGGDVLEVAATDAAAAARAVRLVVGAGIDVWGMQRVRRSLADVVGERLARPNARVEDR